nr:flavin reductase family protein [uncultured Devosia sp.]
MREDVDDMESVIISSGEIEEGAAKASIAGDFRNSMRNLAASVSVVTVGTGGEASGFTATSVVSLSVDTPTIMVSLNRNSASWPLVQKCGRFAVNILSSAHYEIAETFAGRRGLSGVERYIDLRWQKGAGRLPRLRDALAVVECELEEAIQRYSHAILIGRVVNVVTAAGGRPLVYWQGGYNHLCDRERGDQIPR